VPGIWLLAAVAIYIGSHSRGWLDTQPRDFLLTAWTIQAALLGLVVVLLTFLFQLITLRLAYETSLLPFLAKKSHLKLVVNGNIFFVIVNLITVARAGEHFVSFGCSYTITLSLVFLTVSSVFVFNKTTSWLDPDAIESGLAELIRVEITQTLEQEAVFAAAQNILSAVCAENLIQFSLLDARRELPAIRSIEAGVVRDINLARLAQFAAALVSEIPGGIDGPRRAIVVKGVGAAVTDAYRILARVSAPDDTPQNANRLRRAYQLERSEQ
jgi:hypothetical protein